MPNNYRKANGKKGSGKKWRKRPEPGKVENLKSRLPGFGGYLRSLRNEKDVTLKELADYLGFSSAYLCDIEFSRRKPPTMDVIFKMALKLGVSPEQLLSASQKERGHATFSLEAATPSQRELAMVLTVLWPKVRSSQVKKISDILDPALKKELRALISDN